MQLNTQATMLRRSRATNTTDTSYDTFASILGFVNRPTGVGDAVAQTTKGVWDLIGFTQTDNVVLPNSAILTPFGFHASPNNKIFVMRFDIYKLAMEAGNLNTAEWIRQSLLEVTCTMSSNIPGLSGGLVANTNCFCDTIAVVGTSGNQGVSVDIYSPADDATPGTVQVSLKGAHILMPVFKNADGGGNPATSCNTLIQLLW